MIFFGFRSITSNLYFVRLRSGEEEKISIFLFFSTLDVRNDSIIKNCIFSKKIFLNQFLSKNYEIHLAFALNTTQECSEQAIPFNWMWLMISHSSAYICVFLSRVWGTQNTQKPEKWRKNSGKTLKFYSKLLRDALWGQSRHRQQIFFASHTN